MSTSEGGTAPGSEVEASGTTETAPAKPAESPARTARDLFEAVAAGWPFGHLLPWREGWPWRDGEETPGLPIRVEEVTEGDTLVVRAELPGVDPDRDIDVSVDHDVLTIRAERRERTEEKGAGSYRSEFRYGSFVRRVPLPRGTAPEVVSATYRDGVLEVRLPAPEGGAAARKIPVSRG